MVAIKDLESLNNLSTFLTVPLLAAGYITSKKVTFQLDNPVASLFQVAPDVLYFSIAFIMIMALIIVSSQLHKYIYVLSFILFCFVALASLTVGLCKIPMLVMGGMQGSVPAHDIFWTLGYITGGFAIIRVAGANLH